MSKKSLLDPVIIAQLGNLHLRARRILDGLYSGHHINLMRGHSQDFSEHRPYNPGDDPKGLDWKVFGRTDRLVIKQYEDQTSVGAIVLIDDSSSMAYQAQGRVSKIDYVKTMAAAIGYLVVAQHDAIGFSSTRTFLPPSGGRGHLEQYFSQLDSIEAKGVWDVSSLSRSMGKILKRRSFVVVFSDLWHDTDELISTLRALHARHHEVIVFQILDPSEIEFPFSGPMVFEDMETGETLRTDADAIKDSYRELILQRESHLAHVFRSSNIDFHSIQTNTSFDKGLGAYLSWREAHL